MIFLFYVCLKVYNSVMVYAIRLFLSILYSLYINFYFMNCTTKFWENLRLHCSIIVSHFLCATHFTICQFAPSNSKIALIYLLLNTIILNIYFFIISLHLISLYTSNQCRIKCITYDLCFYDS
jgi:hypothetical protein